MEKRKQIFTEQFKANYEFAGAAVVMGAPILDGEVLTNHFVKVLSHEDFAFRKPSVFVVMLSFSNTICNRH